MLMKHEEHGFHNANGSEVAEMKQNGWVEITQKEFDALIAKKRGTIVQPEKVQQDAKGKPGRKPKNKADDLGDGNSTNSD